MKLILRCSSSHEDYFGCSYALVDIDKKRARFLLDSIQQVQEQKAKNDQLYRISYWSYIARYFSPSGDASGTDEDQQVSPEVTEQLEALVPGMDGEYVEVPETFELPEGAEARTEIDMLNVYEDAIGFTCSPKHTDVAIDTERIPMSLLRKIAGLEE